MCQFKVVQVAGGVPGCSLEAAPTDQAGVRVGAGVVPCAQQAAADSHALYYVPWCGMLNTQCSLLTTASLSTSGDHTLNTGGTYEKSPSC
ncbi:hypothetical protein E2C01_043281 [Portunus trituberculatus]|uniref:Uncharacterized protein n=1 Tax=Portunus trituberculatus TaxID=210409 RepID=A0A5B7FVW8_PORTR|nr:hypothetical protein [Portunus trituberculatus]